MEELAFECDCRNTFIGIWQIFNLGMVTGQMGIWKRSTAILRFHHDVYRSLTSFDLLTANWWIYKCAAYRLNQISLCCISYKNKNWYSVFSSAEKVFAFENLPLQAIEVYPPYMQIRYNIYTYNSHYCINMYDGPSVVVDLLLAILKLTKHIMT